VEKLRVIVKKALPSAVEAVKWGTPNHSINGKNVAYFMLNLREIMWESIYPT
jgi:uncharacterized protein YdhG (YjbR/CyaY superfamily)